MPSAFYRCRHKCHKVSWCWLCFTFRSIFETGLVLFMVFVYCIYCVQVQHIVLCGHYDCGGISAAVRNDDHPSPLANWLRNIRDVYPDQRPKQKLIDGIFAKNCRRKWPQKRTLRKYATIGLPFGCMLCFNSSGTVCTEKSSLLSRLGRCFGSWNPRLWRENPGKSRCVPVEPRNVVSKSCCSGYRCASAEIGGDQCHRASHQPLQDPHRAATPYRDLSKVGGSWDDGYGSKLCCQYMFNGKPSMVNHQFFGPVVAVVEMSFGASLWLCSRSMALFSPRSIPAPPGRCRCWPQFCGVTNLFRWSQQNSKGAEEWVGPLCFFNVFKCLSSTQTMRQGLWPSQWEAGAIGRLSSKNVNILECADCHWLPGWDARLFGWVEGDLQFVRRKEPDAAEPWSFFEVQRGQPGRWGCCRLGRYGTIRQGSPDSKVAMAVSWVNWGGATSLSRNLRSHCFTTQLFQNLELQLRPFVSRIFQMETANFAFLTANQTSQ